MTVTNVDTGRAGQTDECVVELEARRDRGVLAVGRERHDDLASGRRSQRGGGDVEPVGDLRGIEPELVELAQGERGQAVAAALVAGEHRLVDDDDRASAAAPARSPPTCRPVRHRPRRRRRGLGRLMVGFGVDGTATGQGGGKDRTVPEPLYSSNVAARFRRPVPDSLSQTWMVRRGRVSGGRGREGGVGGWHRRGRWLRAGGRTGGGGGVGPGLGRCSTVACTAPATRQERIGEVAGACGGAGVTVAGDRRGRDRRSGAVLVRPAGRERDGGRRVGVDRVAIAEEEHQAHQATPERRAVGVARS